MREAREPLVRAVNEGYRAPDVSQRPRCNRQVAHRRDAGVLPEAKGQIIVPAGLEQSKRALEMLARFGVLSGEPVCGPEDPMRDAGLGRIRSRLNVARKAAACARIDGNSPRT